MKFTANFYSRMLGAIVLAYAGYSFGVANSSASPSQLEVWATSLLTLCGAALGLVLTPYLTIDPLERALKRARTMTFPEIVGNTVGVMVGLLAGVMAAAPLGRLPGVLGEVLPSMAAIIFAHLGYRVARNRKQDFQSLFRSTRRNPTQGRRNRRTLVDTSIIIDGRIIDVIKTGFVTETLLVPRFVLREIQRLADSGDEMTRSKGKRGLDTLRVLQESPHVEIKISEEEFAGIRDVDDKLVALARAENVPLLTNDMNLEHVAQLQGVMVLNLHKLTDAVRIPFAAGDRISVTVRSEGREREQGVGFSTDGTMIVVEDARHLIGQEVSAVVTRVYATQTGRIIFAQLDRRNGRPGGPER